ncbi:MAG: hypothetical protein EHM89_00065 [Acidobacteria bacterium]|nr:MAG: hypothetical protein EHM89_00065 [Acidobacteriota bacterium]
MIMSDADATHQTALNTSIARFTDLFNVDVAEQMDVPWERVLSWLETKPTTRFTDRCPGWSPVVYDPARRARENIKAVYGLVLDYDKKSTWDAVVSLWQSFYGLVYTTKSHNIGAHRLRVVLPLSRTVTADEYARLWIWAARRSQSVDVVADSQAKDASRFWYVPTMPDGDAWRTQRLTGAAIDVDATLPLVEQPPLRVMHPPPLVTTDMKATRARAYLSKIPGAVSGDRGHTQTFNAVAPVMLGFDLDVDTTLSIIASDYNPRCDPPWNEKQLAHKIQSVAVRCQRERGYLLKADARPIYSTQHAAAAAPPLPDEHDVDWRAGCAFKSDGFTFKRAYVNVQRFVCHHPDYRGRWTLNEMTGDVWIDGAPMKETLVHDIRAHADHVLGYSPTPSDVHAAIAKAAEQRPFHPIRQYLDSINWDGTQRLASMALDYLGSDSKLHAEMIRRWMIGAIARALEPGCKLDTALMLFGKQGFFKSTFFAILGGQWHSDSAIDISNKDSFQQIHAAWIYEFSELENVVTGRAESRLKAFMTSTHDMFRAPYARSVVRKARGVALCGSTNRQEILTDDTGSRRFWIVPVAGPIDREQLAHARDQLWAEARVAYESQEPWWFDRKLDEEREESNIEFENEDVWLDTIADFIAAPTVAEVSISALLRDALKLDAARQDRAAQMRVARILKTLGWERQRESTGDRRWRYIRPGTQRRWGFQS